MVQKNKRGLTKYIKTKVGLVRVKLGDSILFQLRIENFYKLLTGFKRVGRFVVSTDKIKYDDKIKYGFVYLTGRTNLIVKKIKIKRFIYSKSKKVFTCSKRSSTKDYYWVDFDKSVNFIRDYGKSFYSGDIKYVFNEDMKKLKKVSNKEIKKRLDNYFFQKHHRHTTLKKKSLEIIEKVKYLLLGWTHLHKEIRISEFGGY